MQVFLRISLILIGWSSVVLVYGQNLSNRGREFWLGYGYNYNFFHEDSLTSRDGQELKLYISSEKATTVIVSISNTTFEKSFNIPANSVNVSITIPKSGAWDARMLNYGLMNRSIHVVSTEPVAVYAHQFNTMVSGATMLLPKESYGYTYYSVNFAQDRSGSRYPPFDPKAPVINGDDWIAFHFFA